MTHIIYESPLNDSDWDWDEFDITVPSPDAGDGLLFCAFAGQDVRRVVLSPTEVEKVRDALTAWLEYRNKK